MKTSIELRRALESYLTDNGLTREDFAAQFGVTEATLSRWINGQITSIKQKNWTKLKSILKDHLGDHREPALRDESFDYVVRADARRRSDNPSPRGLRFDALEDDEKRLLCLYRSLPMVSRSRIMDLAVDESARLMRQLGSRRT